MGPEFKILTFQFFVKLVDAFLYGCIFYSYLQIAEFKIQQFVIAEVEPEGRIVVLHRHFSS